MADQRQRRSPEPDAAGDVHQVAQQGVSDGGSALPHFATIQAAFGRHDVSHVRAHVGGSAETASASLGAQAYATGDHVAFAESPDLHLAAHEAAHTVQQRGGVQLSGGVGQTGDRHERHADEVADLVVQGKSAERALDGYSATSVAGDSVQRSEQVRLPHSTNNLVVPTWARAETTKIQRELRRLGLYTLANDGRLGKRSEAGLVEAFGDDSWRELPAADVLARLKAAKPAAGDRGEHALRYGEMFADGLLDMTLGLGFDELGNHKNVLQSMTAALAARSFVVDNALGMRLYTEAGRSVPANPFGSFWVKPNALTFTPPAGAARPIHAVIRLVHSPDGTQGAEAAQAFKRGLVESDATFYSGHGRYGSGPDFDGNCTIELLDAKHNREAIFDDYQKLEHHLAAEGRPHGRGAWAQFEWRAGRGLAVVVGANRGNVRMTSTNPHSGEFGANLIHWHLNQSHTAPVTGKHGELEHQAKAHPHRKYRVSVFNGCRTNDYENSLRATPGMDKQSTDTFASTVPLLWEDQAWSMVAFLDSILHMQSAEDTAKAMDNQQRSTGPGVPVSQAGTGTIKAYGTDDNPVYK